MRLRRIAAAAFVVACAAMTATSCSFGAENINTSGTVGGVSPVNPFGEISFTLLDSETTFECRIEVENNCSLLVQGMRIWVTASKNLYGVGCVEEIDIITNTISV